MAVLATSIVNERTGETIVSDANEAKGLWKSFTGLMFRETIPDGYGLVFRPAQGIHTQFMRFPIDIIFLDKANRVSKIREAMPPWRFDLTMAAACIEMNSGTVRHLDLQRGDTLRFDAMGVGTSPGTNSAADPSQR